MAERPPRVAAAPPWPAARVPAAAAQVRHVVFVVRGRAAVSAESGRTEHESARVVRAFAWE